MISTELHPWNPRLAWLLGPSLFGSAAWWLIVATALHGRVNWQQAEMTVVVGFILFGLASLAIWLGVIFVGSYLVTSPAVQAALAATVSLPLLFFFPLAAWSGLATVGVFGGIWWGLRQGANEAHDRLQIRPYPLLSQVVPVVLLVVMGAVSLLYYQQLRQTDRSPQELIQRLVTQTVDLTERFLPLVYKGYRPELTVDAFLLSQVPDTASILNSLNVNVGQQALPTLSRPELDQARQELSQRLGLSLTGAMSMHDALVAFVAKQYEGAVVRYVRFIPALLALALFFLLRLASPLFRWATVSLGWLYFRLLRALHIVIVDHQTVPAERLIWVR